eukprot:PITA_17534
MENPTAGHRIVPVTETQVLLDVMPRDTAEFPESKITWFAFKLAFLEKVASGLGKLAFLWATAVVLGGFAGYLKTADFWCVTIILFTEGVRIFSRCQEVVWHHENTLKSMETLSEEARRVGNGFYNTCYSISIKIFGCWSSENSEEEDSDYHDSQKRSWSMSMVRFLYCLQLLSASTIVGLSLYRLLRHNYIVNSGNDTMNLKSALIILYAMSLAEAFLFLLEKTYWKISAKKLLEEVNNAYGFNFDNPELHTVRCFLYDTYSRCVKGNIFDASKMEFVSYSVELLQSSSADGQLTGARVLSALARNEQFAERTLRAIGTMKDVVERLIDMLNFKNVDEKEIRKAAAEIISKLVENKRHCVWVTAITGLMESVATLLYSNDSNEGGFVSLGLTIVKKLAEERSNRHKINISRGLIPKIISLTDLEPSDLQFEPNAFQLEIERNKKIPFATEVEELALQIVKTLVSTTGSTGKDLRKRMLRIVFAISNLRNVLQCTERDDLRILAIETLTNLAHEQKGRESIGRTGGILRKLCSLFFMERINNNDEKEKLVKTAGEALGLLSLESEPNCKKMMSIKVDRHPNVLASLISMLNDAVKGIHAARILRNLLEYADANYVKPTEITALAEQILKLVRKEHSCNHKHKRVAIGLREKHSCEYQEAAIGLAARFMTKWDFTQEFRELMLLKLVKVFESHPYPSKMVPNVRRYSIEVLIAVLKRDKGALEQRPELVSDLERALEGVMETTSDWEYYSAFSGSKGLSRHGIPILSLAQDAMELLPK